MVNRRAFDQSVLVGLALNCKIARHTKWDRKSYYYPDMPKNYQISQFDQPIAAEGYFDIPRDIGSSRVRIRRAHLEEDAGKNIHGPSGLTWVDLNRAGTPLLEIVTEPDLASAEDAYTFCTQLQKLVTYLGVSEGNMKKGQMRFEPNVNVAIMQDDQEFRTPISEIKNLNSFRAVRDAIAYESQRQVATWREDSDYILSKRPNENRGWNADKGITEFQREKEAAHDYRYFPDPDLVPVVISSTQLDEIRSRMPELPIDRRRRFVEELELSQKDAETIVGHRPTADLFEAVISAGASVAIAAKQFVNVWLKLANDRGVPVTDLGVDARGMAELCVMVDEGMVSRSAANQLATAMAKQSEPPPIPPTEPQASACTISPSFRDLAQEMGLIQETDTSATETWINQVFAANSQAVDDARSNPKKAKAAAGFLRGQVMKHSGGKADPKLVRRLIELRLADQS